MTENAEQNLDLETEAADTEVAQEEEGSEPSIKDQAIAMGWRPRDEFNGDERYWSDAEEFVRKGNESLPILRNNMKTLQRDLHSMKTDLALQKDIHKTGLEAQRKQIVADYDAKALEAVREGDEEAFKQASRQRDAGLEAYREPEPDLSRLAVDEFRQRNTWFGDNQAATDFADAESGRLRSSNPNLSPEENLERVEQAVKTTFPDLFEKPKRPRAAAVGSGRRPSAKAKTGSYASMPPDFRAACDNWVSLGGSTQEAYVQNYYNMSEDKR